MTVFVEIIFFANEVKYRLTALTEAETMTNEANFFTRYILLPCKYMDRVESTIFHF